MHKKTIFPFVEPTVIAFPLSSSSFHSAGPPPTYGTIPRGQMPRFSRGHRLPSSKSLGPCMRGGAVPACPDHGYTWHCWRMAPVPRRSLRTRTSCRGGAMEPVGTVREGMGLAVDQEEAVEVAPEKLKVLEAAIAGVDEGQRPMDYDRRAHIFEESSHVFRVLKHQRDGDRGPK